MTNVEVSPGASEPPYKAQFEYHDGYYDRREREFLGFNTIKKFEMDGGNIYRTSVMTYLNKSIVLPGNTDLYSNSTNSAIRQYYYTQGLVSSTVTYKGLDALNIKLNESLNTYKFISGLPYSGTVSDFVTSSLSINPGLGDLSWVIPVLQQSISREYENGSYAEDTKNINTVDIFGNVRSFTRTTGSNTYTALVDYNYNLANTLYLTGLAKKHSVGGRVTEITSFSSKGQPLIIQRKNGSGNVLAEYELGYNPTFGFNNYIKMPKGQGTQRQEYIFNPEGTMYTYPASVQNVSLGYTSYSNYDLKFGVPISTTDINGVVFSYNYDSFGRLINFSAPAYHTSPLIIHEYQSDLDGATGHTYAFTKHYDPEFPGNFIYTSTFVDKLGRPVLVKKEIDGQACSANGSAWGQPKFSLTGFVVYDQFGRSVEKYQPKDDPSGGTDDAIAKQFVSISDESYKTTITYDEKNRPLTSKLHKDNTALLQDITTTYAYSIQNGGIQSLIAMPSNKSNATVTDMWGRTLSQSQIGGSTLTTTFAYNIFGELLTSTDPLSKSTSYVYNDLGQLTSTTHPDAGTTNLVNYPNGQLHFKTIQNNHTTEYQYNYSQLQQVVFPTHTVTYTYGNNSATNYRKGRLTTVEDMTGTRQFSYGPLGEIKVDDRYVVDPVEGPVHFVTTYVYDAWGRVKTLTYPDGEIVTYGYDHGGNLNSMSSPEDGVILVCSEYNAAGKISKLQYGNSRADRYTYSDQQLLHIVRMVEVTSNRTYAYDDNLNISSITGDANKTYTYDSFNRLATASGDVIIGDTIYVIHSICNMMRRIISQRKYKHR